MSGAHLKSTRRLIIPKVNPNNYSGVNPTFESVGGISHIFVVCLTYGWRSLCASSPKISRSPSLSMQPQVRPDRRKASRRRAIPRQNHHSALRQHSRPDSPHNPASRTIISRTVRQTDSLAIILRRAHSRAVSPISPISRTIIPSRASR